MAQTQPTTNGLYDEERSSAAIRAAVADGAVPIAVYGLGKMGLPLATVLAERTGRVIGVDTDPAVVDGLTDGRCHVTGEPGLSEAVASVVSRGALRATTDGTAAAQEAALHVIIVPTLVDEQGHPDLAPIDAVVETIASGLTPGDLVVLESTVPPGTCRDRVHPALVERSTVSSGDFGLAFCPERTKSGRALADIRGAYPKIVGGIDEESTRAARAVYSVLTDNDVIAVSDCTTAECVKVFEGVYRDVNIALANELSGLADELSVDVLEAIDVANTLPYADIHTPGAGVGGHCIPVYPHFLIGGCETKTPLLATARGVNERMPEMVVDRLEAGLERRSDRLPDATVAILGVTYRSGVDEIRNSPAIPIAEMLREVGATVYTVDPVATNMAAVPGEPVDLARLPELGLDGVVLVTDHEAFRSYDWTCLDRLVIVDGRHVVGDDHDHLLYTIGRGFTNPP